MRSQKAKRRVEKGEWINPASLHPPTPVEQGERARKGRRREVDAGIWRNPALSATARQKLSRPRRHAGVLHQAIEKLSVGKMQDLSGEEADAYLLYRAELRTASRAEINRKARERYRKRHPKLTPDERQGQASSPAEITETVLFDGE